MADHATTPQLFYDGQWRNAAVYTRDGIATSRGAPGEGQDSPPSTATLTLDNRDGNASPRNPTGALYGLAGRNTPMRIVADGSVRSTTEAASWKPGRAVKGDAWMQIEGGGLLRRLQIGNKPLASVAYRSLTSSSDNANRVAYWPCEEESSASSIFSPYGSPAPGTAGTISFGGYTDALSTPRMLTFGSANAQLFFPIPDYSSSEHKVVSLWTLPDPSLAASTVIMRMYCTGGNVGILDVEYGVTFDGTLRLNAYGPAGLVDSGNFINWDDYIVAQHFLMSIELTQNGADVDSRFFIENMDHGTLGAAGDDVLTGVTIGRIYAIAIAEGDCTGAAFGQLAVGSSIGAFSTFIGNIGGVVGARGYLGETAGERFLRLGLEAGVATVVDGDETDTQPMGAQPVDTLVNLLRECVRTDDGLMYEPRDELAVAMRPGRSRYNQASALDLSYTGEQIAPVLQPVLDDRGIRNDVTVKRRNGSTARAVRETGPLNVSDPIDDPEGIGRVAVQVDVNTSTDEVLTDHANWHLHKGTVDEPRYPQVTVDLDAPGATSALITAVNAVEIGDRLTVGDMPIEDAPDGANLLVLGIKETLPAKRRLVTFVCAPASPYEIGIVGENDGSTDLRGQAVDTDNSTLASDVSQFATTLSVASTGGVLWTTAADDWSTSLNGEGLYGGGLFIAVGGEVMRVTNITGASSPQTFTVVRSVNGVVKSHLAAAAVHVFHPIVVGL
jgi:hypothetical protein